MPYLYDDLVWCTATAKPIPDWRKVIDLLSVWLWAIIFFLGYLNSGLFYFLFRMESNYTFNYVKITLYMLGCFVGVPTFFNPKRLIFRIIFGCTLFFAIFFMASFNCFFLEFQTTPRYFKQIDSIQELFDEKMELFGVNESVLYNSKQDDEVHFVFTYVNHLIVFNIFSLHLNVKRI